MSADVALQRLDACTTERTDPDEMPKPFSAVLRRMSRKSNNSSGNSNSNSNSNDSGSAAGSTASGSGSGSNALAMSGPSSGTEQHRHESPAAAAAGVQGDGQGPDGEDSASASSHNDGNMILRGDAGQAAQGSEPMLVDEPEDMDAEEEVRLHSQEKQERARVATAAAAAPESERQQSGRGLPRLGSTAGKHRSLPSIAVQDLRISSPTTASHDLQQQQTSSPTTIESPTSIHDPSSLRPDVNIIPATPTDPRATGGAGRDAKGDFMRAVREASDLPSSSSSKPASSVSQQQTAAGDHAAASSDNGQPQRSDVTGASTVERSSASISRQAPPSSMSGFPKRQILQRLPSQAIADTPSTEGSFSPGESVAQTPASEAGGGSGAPPPRSLLGLAAQKAAAQKQNEAAASDSGVGGTDYASQEQRNKNQSQYGFPASSDTIAEEDPNLLSPPSESSDNKEGTLSTSPGSLSPAEYRPRPALNPYQRSASQYSSRGSSNEYSTPAGFLKHRRSSSHNGPHEVKETYNAGYKDLPDGKRKLNQYIITSDIGRGSFGVVQLAKDEVTGQEYAVKEFSKMRLRKRRQSELIRRSARGGTRRGAVPMRRASPRSPDSSSADPGGGDASDSGKNDMDLIRNEVAIMKKVDHPNVVKLFEVLDVVEDDSLFMVVELCANGPLMSLSIGQRVAPLSEDEARSYFRQIILAIEYLHFNGIIHRDIKPENILKMANNDIVKLVDFGVSEIFEKEDADNPKELKTGGSPAFMAPELVMPHHGGISAKAADIWALGVTLYCMVVGTLPFESTQMLELYEKIQSEPAKIPKELDPDLKDLLKRLLDKNPDTRIKMPDLREHSWITCNGSDPLPSMEQNVSQLAEVTEEDVREAINVPSVSYIVNAVRAASRWKRFAARRTRSEGQDSTNSSIGSSAMDLSRNGSVDVLSSPAETAETGDTSARDVSSGSRQTSLDTASSPGASNRLGSSPSASFGNVNAGKQVGQPPTHAQHFQQQQPSISATMKLAQAMAENAWQQASAIKRSDSPASIQSAASFPQTASRQDKFRRPGSIDFPSITSRDSHVEHLSGGIDDCNVETLRYYEEQTGHYMPRDAVLSAGVEDRIGASTPDSGSRRASLV